MNTDSYFAIGSNHFVCEDYAGHTKDRVVISDGCSHGGNSNKHKTDFGARLLTLAAMEHLERYDMLNEDEFAQGVMSTVEVMRRSLNLKLDSLAATLLALKHNSKDDAILGFMCGDGVIGGRKRDGTWDVSIIEFPSNAPFYFRYLMEGGVVEDYTMMFGDKYVETHLQGDITDPKGYDTSTCNLTIKDKKYFQTYYPTEMYEFVFIASDGLGSFKKLIHTETTKHHERVALRDVASTILNIKNFKGDFLRRHMQWQFEKDLEGTAKHNGWNHEDDLGLGVIYCGKN